jgi:hypothetical protein
MTHGWSVKQIGRALAVSDAAAKTRLHRAPEAFEDNRTWPHHRVLTRPTVPIHDIEDRTIVPRPETLFARNASDRRITRTSSFDARPRYNQAPSILVARFKFGYAVLEEHYHEDGLARIR